MAGWCRDLTLLLLPLVACLVSQSAASTRPSDGKLDSQGIYIAPYVYINFNHVVESVLSLKLS